ncbi:MAG: hypothetical protein JF603_13790 [Acidobacteria bacterium]|nr:hypothetical protein [Acidobacteriota bacterium]
MTTTTAMRMTGTVHADQSRARQHLIAGMPRVSGLVPCTGIGHGPGVPSHSWTNATAVTTKALKAFGAYGARRLEEHST